MPNQTLVVPLFAWILWMDQTVYTIPANPDDSASRQLETAASRHAQLAVTSTRGECESLRQARIREAATREAAEDASKGPRPRYREQHRYFCSPAVDDVKK